MVRLRVLLLAVAFCAQRCCAQTGGWATGQSNATMCTWQTPRVGVVRDTVYIDGGYLWWKPGFSDGSYGGIQQDENPLGLVWSLNFSLPFLTTPDFNQSTLFGNFSKGPGGSEANNIGPNYVDGTMFANDYEWWTYGGLLEYSSAYQMPLGNSVGLYEVYPTAPLQRPDAGFLLSTVPSGMSRYVTYGAGVSVPSENLGFYFGGTKSKSGGPIYYPTNNESWNADHLSTTLIEVDMALIPPGSATWTNNSFSPPIQGRVSGELAWIPVSEKGILVGVGGVTSLVYTTPNQSVSGGDAAQVAADSTAFMDSVAVYDIANKKWYEQKTTGPQPIAFAQGCSVVASAQDNSSHNIYWYGGFDGSDPEGVFSDAVWVLSIPSFTWAKVSDGVAGHARAGHRCVKPYPDQMFVIGGYASLGIANNCVEGGIIQVFNLSSAQWLDSYDPNTFYPYQVPEAVVSKIGGNGSGSATLSIPPPGFASPSMTALLASKYNASKITNWYPYKEAAQTSSVPSSPPATTKSSGTPKYLAPVLAVILGLFFITLLILGCLLWRRRKLLSTNRASQSESGTMDMRFRVSKWLRGTPASDAKSATAATEEPIASGYKYDLLHERMPEAGGVQVHEMMDTSSPAELHSSRPRDTTLTETILSETGLVAISQASPHELASNTEKSSQRRVSTGSVPRVDSPTVTGNVSPGFEHGHARGLSDATISTEGDQVASVEGGRDQPAAEGVVSTLQGQRAGAVSPMTPTEVSRSPAGDYLNKGHEPAQESQAEATRRTSNFSEDLDDAK